jgi:hypothetical protein
MSTCVPVLLKKSLLVPFEVFLFFNISFSSSLSNRWIHEVVKSNFVLFFRAVWARARASMITITGNAQTYSVVSVQWCIQYTRNIFWNFYIILSGLFCIGSAYKESLFVLAQHTRNLILHWLRIPGSLSVLAQHTRNLILHWLRIPGSLSVLAQHTRNLILHWLRIPGISFCIVSAYQESHSALSQHTRNLILHWLRIPGIISSIVSAYKESHSALAQNTSNLILHCLRIPGISFCIGSTY